MQKTKIEWARNPDGSLGFSWNPITGCLNHADGMCKGGGFPCYAYRLANARLRERYLANKNIAGDQQQYKETVIHNLAAPFYPRFWPEKLEEMKKLSRWHGIYYPSDIEHGRKGIFVCSMGDLFGIGVPEQWTRDVLDVIRECPQHRFYLLTKQPQNLTKYSPFPDNAWVGVTATDTRMFVPAINWLDETEAKIKYISFEPLLGHIPINSEALKMAGISWVIIGAQTKPTRLPKIEWVKEIVEACDKAGVPVFLKDNLRPLVSGIETEERPIAWAFN